MGEGEKGMSRRFSERSGLVKVEIQLQGMTAELRNVIWNFVRAQIPDREAEARPLVEYITREVLRESLDAIRFPSRNWRWVQVEDLAWPRVYDLLEWAVARLVNMKPERSKEMWSKVNSLLEGEQSGYRFVGGELTRNIHPAEAAEVERAMARAASSGLDGVQRQIEQALALFGKRPEPDYRNAIKEAISAVEGVVKLINGTRGGGLSAALDAVSERIALHPSLKAGLDKLYGYTSDEDGIRHAILEERSISEDDARYMIVTCSAFVNFLVSKADKAGLLKSR